MARAFKCDRCKELYEPYNFLKISDKKVITVSVDINTSLDLCPCCYKHLYDWIYEGEIKNEA